MRGEGNALESKQMSRKIISILEEKKAHDIIAINIENISVIAEYFVICNGTSTPHIKSLADEIEKRFETEDNLRVRHREGYNSARWILLDYGDVIVHIFHKDDREFYDIERLWSDGVVTYSSETVSL